MSKDRNHFRLLHYRRRKKRFFQYIYEFTADKCDLCAVTGCLCSDRICAHVESCAAKHGQKFPVGKHRLRFIGDKGCVVPPHYRETCTLFLCEEAIKKPEFPKGYYERLLRIAGKLEYKIMELEDSK